MSFIKIAIITFVITAIISAMDKWVWSKKREQNLLEARKKKRNLSFEQELKVVEKPSWIEQADSLFILSIAAMIVWTMLPNFELILVVALALSAIVSVVEKTWVKKRKAIELEALYQKNQNPSDLELQHTEKLPWWVDYGWSFFPLLLVIVLLRSFVYEPFKIPSGSMQPTLWVHDFILVNKYAYGLRLPVTKTKITEGGKPKRGDVVVFRAPHEPEKDYIKRLIGLPGDTVYYNSAQQVFLKPACRTEDETVETESLGLKCGVKNEIVHSLVEARGFTDPAHTYDVYKENLAGVEHELLLRPDLSSSVERYPFRLDIYNDIIREFSDKGDTNLRLAFAKAGHFREDWQKGVLIPEDGFFVLGDNRNNSLDSRFWGFVPESMMVGKAEAVWLHLEFGLAESGLMSYIPTGINFDRVGGIK